MLSNVVTVRVEEVASKSCYGPMGARGKVDRYMDNGVFKSHIGTYEMKYIVWDLDEEAHYPIRIVGCGGSL